MSSFSTSISHLHLYSADTDYMGQALDGILNDHSESLVSYPIRLTMELRGCKQSVVLRVYTQCDNTGLRNDPCLLAPICLQDPPARQNLTDAPPHGTGPCSASSDWGIANRISSN